MKRLAGLIAVLAVIAVPALADQPRDLVVQPRPGASGLSAYTDSWAVLIGINDYQHARIPKLQYAVNDATAVERVLLAQGFRPDRIIRLLDRQATKAKIETVLGDELKQKTGPNDRVLVFFAGHGKTDRLKSGEEEGYLIPVDGDPSRLFSTAVSMSALRQISDRLPAKHILYVVDACYSGYALFNRSISDDLLEEMVKKPAIQILTAGRQQDQAQERGGHGVFTDVLLRGLQGDAFSGKGWLALEELGVWVKQRVWAESNKKQLPQFGNLAGEGQFVFVKAAASGGPSSPVGQPKEHEAKPIEEARVRPYEGFSNVPTDEAEAARFYEQYCQKGNPEACTELGRLLMYGWGVGKDQERAFTLLRQSCEGGYAHGCGGLGKLYYEGWGVPRDQDRARSFWQKACEGNVGASCYVIANGYDKGLWGLPKDSTQATKFFRRAASLLPEECERGKLSSCSALGSLYLSGQGLPRDESRAVKLFERSCDRGEPSGCGHLGYAYQWGVGVIKNEDYAAVLYRKACERGEPQGCELAKKK